MINKIDAIISLVPNAEVSVNGEEVYWIKPSIAPVTEEQIQAEIVRLTALEPIRQYSKAIDLHINKIARSKQYNDAVSLASYADSTNSQWKQEALTFIAWRDSVWLFAFEKLKEVQQGLIPQPTIEELIVSLPTINW